MGKYVDIDALGRYLFSKVGLFSSVPLGTVLDHMADYADRNYADVVPREEVDRLHSILDCYALQYGTVKSQQEVIDRVKQETAMGIFAELELKAPFFCENKIAYEHFHEEFADIKKKYTEYEAEKDCLCPRCREKKTMNKKGGGFPPSFFFRCPRFFP